MKTILQFAAISISTLFITGCISLAPLHNIDDHTIIQELSEQQVKEAIHEGIEQANEGIEQAEWTIKNEAPGKILATYNRHVHLIAVNIRYTEKNYSINYAYSKNMKVHCTDKHLGGVSLTSWPEETCGGAQPAMIHKAYNKWVNRLHSEIKTALSSTKQGKFTHESKIDATHASTRKSNSTHETECKFSKSKCFKKARTQCKGPYKVLSSDRYWGGIFANVLPGPVRWYTITYECRQSEGDKPRDTYTEILKLDDLRKRGLITDTEFESQKTKLLLGN